MQVESRYNLGDVVYVKSVLGKHVTRGIVDGVEFKAYSTDFKGTATSMMFQYRVWVTDRPGNAGRHMHEPALETNCFPSWEDAWWERRIGPAEHKI